MDVLRDDVRSSFQGPLADIDGLPLGLLYGLVLTFAHTAGPRIVQELTAALRPVAGEPLAVRRRLLGWRLAYDGLLLDVAAGKREVQVAVGQRLRATRLAELVAALGQVPGASDLRLEGHRRTFAPPGTKDGPPLDG